MSDPGDRNGKGASAAPARPTVGVRRATEATADAVVGELFALLGAADAIRRGDHVAVKPNLCCEIPEKIASANTAPEVVEAVVKHLVDLGARVTLVESDGLRYKADLAYELTGLRPLEERYGARWVNLSEAPLVRVDNPWCELELPVLLEEADAVVTLPVMKTHALTVFTGGIKNLWGCVPRYDRIVLHRWLDELLAFVGARWRPALSIMDGIVAVEGRGPVNGVPRRTEILVGGDDAVATDAVAMRLMGLDPASARHLRLAEEAGAGRIAEEAIRVDGPFADLRFQCDPARLDWAIAGMNHMTRYPFFVHKILLNQAVFDVGKAVVQLGRKAGIVRGPAGKTIGV